MGSPVERDNIPRSGKTRLGLAINQNLPFMDGHNLTLHASASYVRMDEPIKGMSVTWTSFRMPQVPVGSR
jgi:hypothetical protein